MNQVLKLLKSFTYAFSGVKNTVKTQRNMRIHICAVVFVIIFGIMQKLDSISWTLEIICCGFVIALELVNTAIESACDSITRQKRYEIKICKDAAAGAVLVGAFTSVVIWVVILLTGHGGEFFGNVKDAFNRQWGYIATGGWLILSAFFIFYRKKK